MHEAQVGAAKEYVVMTCQHGLIRVTAIRLLWLGRLVVLFAEVRDVLNRPERLVKRRHRAPSIPVS